MLLVVPAGTAVGQDPSGAPPDAPGNDPQQPPRRPDTAPTRGPAGLPEGVTREQMWWAPTAEDWKKPCLITWQRTWEDAVAVSEETGKPILICVNMDGEIASEHYAGVRYRQPEIAALYEPYVCVVASVYRHNPRDYDDQGRRIPCPRFGTVTCGEHIAIEPILYEKYFDGRRVAPRHIMIELDGKEEYDVYFTWDTDSVFDAVREGIAERDVVPKTIVRGDRPIVERVASHDVRDRMAVEKAYQEGDRDVRKDLLEAAMGAPDVASVDLLRLGVFGFDDEMAKLARQALARTESEAAVDLIPEALRLPMGDSEREALIAALTKIGESSSASPRARWLSVVHTGLASDASSVDVEGWSTALAGAEYPAAPNDWGDLESELETKTELAEQRPDDAQALLDVAEAALEFGVEASQAFGVESEGDEILTASPDAARIIARSKYHEAQRSALEAEKLGASGWRLDAVLALAAYYLGDLGEAYGRAEKAVGEIPSGATDWSAMAVLTVFAEGRFQDIKKAVQEKRRWPPRWLTDVNSAYSVLLHHPLSTDAQVVWYYDFLTWLGAKHRASRVLDESLTRFPASWILHDRLRARILEDEGVEGLEARYEAMLKDERMRDVSLEWYAGLASFVAAEFHRRAGDQETALAAYDRSIAHYESAVVADPECRESADFNIALALAGRARLALEREDYERALADILASFDREPEAAGTLDGLNMTPASTAQLLQARFQELGREQDAATVQAALDKLDPEMLVAPFDRNLPEGPPPDRRQPGGRRRGGERPR
jgi:tetratricopeptide (TPR) repeat protein